jgi:hypothetical protein
MSAEEGSSFFWQYQRSQNKEVKTTAASTFSGELDITSKETILEQVRNRSLEFEKNIRQQGGKITHSFVEELYKNEVQENSGPSAAFAAVISIAVAIATGGAGGIATQFGSYITQASAAVAGTTTASVISGMSSAMMTTLCAQSAVALVASKGDIFKAAESILSVSTLKNLAFSMATAGLTQGFGGALGVELDVSSFGSDVMKHMQYQALQAGVGLSLDLVSGQELDEALLNRLKSAATNTLSGMAANVIGGEFKTEKIDTVTHKLLHAIVGGASGAFLSKDVGSGIVSGALGALIAETMTDLLYSEGQVNEKVKKAESEKGRTLTKEEFAAEYVTAEWNVKKETYDWSRLTAATAVMLSGYDVNVADLTATNALDHNFLAVIYGGIIVASAVSTAYLAYQFTDTLQKEGLEAACNKHGFDIGILIAGGAAAKGGAKLVAKLFENCPALRVALSGSMEKIVKAADKFLESYQKRVGKTAKIKNSDNEYFMSGKGSGEFIPDLKIDPNAKYVKSLPPTRIVQKRVQGLVSKIEKIPGAIVTQAKKDGYIIKIPNGKRHIEVKIMNKGGQRDAPYFRVSEPGKRILTRDGIPSSDKALTHIPIDSRTTVDDIIKLVKVLRKF